jgi:rhodanese-related sulfurtransferase
VFHDQVELLVDWISRFGAGMLLVLLLALAAYLALKLWIRHRFVSRVRAARIGPAEVWSRLRAGEPVTIVDLRHSSEVSQCGAKLPGALQILPDQLAKRRDEIPDGKELILYCSCPNEATSARTAMRLQKMGYGEIRPLLGGFDGWVQAGFPVESLRAPKLGAPLPLMYSNQPTEDAVAASAPAQKAP